MNKKLTFEPTKDFRTAFNYFDPKPLFGAELDHFYISEFSSDAVEELFTTVDISERYRKLLVIGHRGCGKSTILNKLVRKLERDHHVVEFFASELLNLHEIEAIDILLASHLTLLDAVRKIEEFKNIDIRQQEAEKKERKTGKRSSHEHLDDSRRIPLYDGLLRSFRALFDKLAIPINFEEATISFLGLVSFKYRVEPETRSRLRSRLKGEIRELQSQLSEACATLKSLTGKEPLIIIDDLDKIKSDLAKNIFFENFHLLTEIAAKVIFTYPLDGYYDPAYARHSDLYDEVFIPVANIRTSQGELQQQTLSNLCELVYRRLDRSVIEEDALLHLSEMSGGLLRDLVSFMHVACKLAIRNGASTISKQIADVAVNRKINTFDRVFDALAYLSSLKKLQEDKNQIPNSELVYFLHHLFALEHRSNEEIWYVIHPCLKSALRI